jgi:hypothetical protein
MNKLFNSVKLQKPRTNMFDLSHEKKLSCNMGELVPIYLQEVVPGDKFRVFSEMLVRLAPMVAPMMHRVNAYVHYFFVPNRLVWDNWQDFITGGRLGTDASVLPKIHIPASGGGQGVLLEVGTLWDYFGLPTMNNNGLADALDVSALPFRAYQMIYNEYYRDQNLLAPVSYGTGDSTSGDFAVLVQLRKRAWEKDYLTSALPWTQRGGEVLIPGDPHYLNDSLLKVTGGTAFADGALNASGGKLYSVGSTTVGRVENLESYDISVNDLRTSARLQAWLERNALGGSRYIESILAHFGVKTPDYRLQRPEYLGGGKTPIVVSEVLNTSATATEAQGNMSGHGIGVGKSNSFKKYFTEHGYIIGIMSVLPRTAYQEGIPRMFKKFDNLDYFFPEFANLGEQAIRNDEVYWSLSSSEGVNGAAWGYQSRYAEYKWQPDTVHGDFKSTMSYWHMGRIFGSLPALANAFVESDPTHRIFAVTTTTVDKLYVQIYNQVKAIRPIPVFGSPGIHIV